MFFCRRIYLQGRTFNLPIRRTLSSHSNTPIHALARNHSPFPNALALPQTTVPTSPQDLLAEVSRVSNTTGDIPEHSFNAYSQLRQDQPQLLSQIPTSVYVNLIQQSLRTRTLAVANQLVKDFLQNCSDERERVETLQTLLMSPGTFALSRPTLSLVLRHLHTHPKPLPSLDSIAMEKIVSLALKDESIVSFIYPSLRRLLQEFKSPTGPSSSAYFPPAIVYSTFPLIERMLRFPESHQKVMDIFRVLVDTGQIPAEIAASTDASPNNFSIIILSTMVRASLHWNWRILAFRLSLRVLQLQSPPDSAVTNLVVDVAHALLENPSAVDLENCKQLIQALHQWTPAPDALISQFYDACSQLRLNSLSQDLYEFTRSSGSRLAHLYPLPSGASLYHLFYHLCTSSRKMFLARSLASEVAGGPVFIPLPYRAKFISLVARQGYGSSARKLWQHYSVGRDRRVIVGNAALMLRMVSLFSNLAKRVEDDLQNPQSGKANLETNDRDIPQFIEHIIAEFRSAHTPLSKASHQILTSLARAHFIVGQFSEGFDIFRILLDRNEKPDLYDINIALGAMAEHSPRTAARVVTRMTENGLSPDSVTFGTIMYHALQHNDLPLVREMMEKAQAHTTPNHSTAKSIGNLVRASVESSEDISARQHSLKKAYKVIKAHKIHSPQLGKYLVGLSLSAEAPLRALNFWDLLLKDSVRWNDPEHSFLRLRILQSFNNLENLSPRTRALIAELRRNATR